MKLKKFEDRTIQIEKNEAQMFETINKVIEVNKMFKARITLMEERQVVFEDRQKLLEEANFVLQDRIKLLEERKGKIIEDDKNLEWSKIMKKWLDAHHLLGHKIIEIFEEIVKSNILKQTRDALSKKGEYITNKVGHFWDILKVKASLTLFNMD